MFLDISIAFDKVWHDGLIFKLKCNGISGILLNGTASDWRNVAAGVPQGSVLGPLLFLVYINDLTDNISSEMRLFADDSSLFTRVEGVELTHEKLVKDLQTITNWGYQWKWFLIQTTKQAIEVLFLVKKMKKPVHPELLFNGITLSREDHTKHLGVYSETSE